MKEMWDLRFHQHKLDFFCGAEEKFDREHLLHSEYI